MPLDRLLADELPFALFDDSLDAAGPGWLFHDLAETIECRSPADLTDTFARIDAAAMAGNYVAIAANYELAYWLEPRILNRPYPSTVALLTAHVFRQGLTVTGGVISRAAEVRPDPAPSGIAALSRGMTSDHYLASVARILHHIHEGDCYQVNMTQPLAFSTFGTPFSLYRKLRRAQPVHYGALLQSARQAVLCSSPELFMRRDGTRITVRPMKGTAPRGIDAESDAAFRDSLLKSDKERAENLMIVDLLRNDLGRLAQTGSVVVDQLFDVEPYPTVWQMTSTIHADMPMLPLETIFRALFPCGSVTGAPKIKAMEIISRLEDVPRGLYCGALGFMLPNRDFRFAVPIRTMVLERHAPDRAQGVMSIGSGIVADSDPVAEARECDLKAAFLLRLDPGFALLESLRLDPGGDARYPLLDRHLARLADSAQHFGFSFDERAIREALAAHAAMHAGAQAGVLPRKVRLTLSRAGQIEITSEPIDEAASNSTRDARIYLAPDPLDSRAPLRHYKTTYRSQYDLALARALKRPGGFDAVFLNERGELAEGARSNLLLKIGDRWLTPPLSSGLLPGVMRAHLLDANDMRIEEKTLSLHDLEHADEIRMINAVRGMVTVRYAGPLGESDV